MRVFRSVAVGLLATGLLVALVGACGATPTPSGSPSTGSTASSSSSAIGPSVAPGPTTVEASAAPTVVSEPPPNASDRLPAASGRPGRAPGPPTSDATMAPADLQITAAMLDAIVDQRPELGFDLHPDFSDTGWSVEGNVSDGRGWGRLAVWLNKQAGAMTAHPCGDPEFVQGAACQERMLPTGERLVRRDIVDAHGVRSIQVVLLRPDRSGLSLESTNYRVEIPEPAVLRGDKRWSPTVTRLDPTYTVEQLGDLAVAMMARLR